MKAVLKQMNNLSKRVEVALGQQVLEQCAVDGDCEVAVVHFRVHVAVDRIVAAAAAAAGNVVNRRVFFLRHLLSSQPNKTNERSWCLFVPTLTRCFTLYNRLYNRLDELCK